MGVVKSKSKSSTSNKRWWKYSAPKKEEQETCGKRTITRPKSRRKIPNSTMSKRLHNSLPVLLPVALVTSLWGQLLITYNFLSITCFWHPWLSGYSCITLTALSTAYSWAVCWEFNLALWPQQLPGTLVQAFMSLSLWHSSCLWTVIKYMKPSSPANLSCSL